MGFKDLFKVRQPGNGSKVEEAVKSAIRAARAKRVETKNNSQNSSGKKEVK